jgi:predicted secreted protein
LNLKRRPYGKTEFYRHNASLSSGSLQQHGISGNMFLKIFSGQNKGRVFQLKPGESLLLILSNTGSGGYVVHDLPEFDPEIISFEKMEKKPPSEPDRVGDFGSIEWSFRAKKEGIPALTIRTARPWGEKQRFYGTL